VFCGKLFKPKSYKTTKFCSSKCFARNKSKLHSVIKQCGICGKEIKIKSSIERLINTCSRKCADKLHSQRMLANGNPAWLGGIGKLPWGYEFDGVLKYKVKRRDGFRCRICKKKKKILVIHHIDYDKFNNEMINLITLCLSCHGKTHYNREKWKKELSKMLE
jgi:hypothetical protein